MIGYVEESEEVKAMRALFRAAETYVGQGLIYPNADRGEVLKAAALEYASAVRKDGKGKARRVRP